MTSAGGPVAVRGLGGIEKTLLAIGVAHDLAQTFERVAWLQSVAFH